MVLDLGWLTNLTKWTTPEQREKAKRVRLAEIDKQISKLEKKIPCTDADAAKVEKLQKEKDKIELDLRS